ncbi:MAG: DUF4375 domain-containing protein [Ruminococcaceae bacterium]|nr:DUF4375 domain-containing protein [Oscillospiraceae bacterium]
MKLKIVLLIIEKLFGVTIREDKPRADMYLPERLLAMSLIFLAIGIACTVYAVMYFAVWSIVVAILGTVLGVFALLCWKNQAIHIISDKQFTYTTMFGNTRTYAFSDIQGLRKNQDSLTLFVAGDKVHIESMAVISDRLVSAIKSALVPGAAYLKMSTEELSQLSDDDLIFAVWTRTENIVQSGEDMSKGFHSLCEEQRIFYAINYLETEVNNGGLCQFFVNSSRIVAPVVGKYMGMIGAMEHQKLYEEFIQTHQIDTNDLSSFDCETVDNFQSQYGRYPFDEYDGKFYKLEPLQTNLVPYVKKHIEKF